MHSERCKTENFDQSKLSSLIDQRKVFLKKKLGNSYKNFEAFANTEKMTSSAIRANRNAFLDSPTTTCVPESHQMAGASKRESSIKSHHRLKSECLSTDSRLNQLFKGDIQEKLQRYKKLYYNRRNLKNSETVYA